VFHVGLRQLPQLPTRANDCEHTATTPYSPFIHFNTPWNANEFLNYRDTEAEICVRALYALCMCTYLQRGLFVILRTINVEGGKQQAARKGGSFFD
jgi:hypothetical protein